MELLNTIQNIMNLARCRLPTVVYMPLVNVSLYAVLFMYSSIVI